MTATLAMLISGIFFAFVHSSVKYLPHLPAHEIVFFRSIVSCVITYFALRSLKISPWGNNKKMLVLRGLAGTCALLLYFHTLQSMPLASAVTIQYLHPIFTVVLAGILLKEKPRWWQWGFFALSFVGVLMVESFDTRVVPFDATLGVLSALFSATAYTLIRHLKNEDHPLVVVFYLPMVSLVITGPMTAMDWVM
ncbi:MAG: DMT family transporter, partial [Bdellovibrionota bacterium]